MSQNYKFLENDVCQFLGDHFGFGHQERAILFLLRDLNSADALEALEVALGSALTADLHACAVVLNPNRWGQLLQSETPHYNECMSKAFALLDTYGQHLQRINEADSEIHPTQEGMLEIGKRYLESVVPPLTPDMQRTRAHMIGRLMEINPYLFTGLVGYLGQPGDKNLFSRVLLKSIRKTPEIGQEIVFKHIDLDSLTFEDWNVLCTNNVTKGDALNQLIRFTDMPKRDPDTVLKLLLDACNGGCRVDIATDVLPEQLIQGFANGLIQLQQEYFDQHKVYFSLNRNLKDRLIRSPALSAHQAFSLMLYAPPDDEPFGYMAKRFGRYDFASMELASLFKEVHLYMTQGKHAYQSKSHAHHGARLLINEKLYSAHSASTRLLSGSLFGRLMKTQHLDDLEAPLDSDRRLIDVVPKMVELIRHGSWLKNYLITPKQAERIEEELNALDQMVYKQEERLLQRGLPSRKKPQNVTPAPSGRYDPDSIDHVL